jgi:hypothetical protein
MWRPQNCLFIEKMTSQRRERTGSLGFIHTFADDSPQDLNKFSHIFSHKKNACMITRYSREKVVSVS